MRESLQGSISSSRCWIDGVTRQHSYAASQYQAFKILGQLCKELLSCYVFFYWQETASYASVFHLFVNITQAFCYAVSLVRWYGRVTGGQTNQDDTRVCVLVAHRDRRSADGLGVSFSLLKTVGIDLWAAAGAPSYKLQMNSTVITAVAPTHMWI